MVLVRPEVEASRTHLQRAAEWVTEAWSAPYEQSSCSPMRRLLPLLGFTTRIYLEGLRRDQARAALKRRRLPAFVVSVGNIVAGGTGKTPFVIWMARFLADEPPCGVAILSRGYGSRMGRNAVEQVPKEGDIAELASRFGDEPALMARRLPEAAVWVGRDRFLSGTAAMESSGAKILLLDDGFQHLQLYRDLDIVLLDAERPYGNGELLPLGPLREPPGSLARADALVLTRAEDPGAAHATRSLLEARFPGKPVFACSHRLKCFTIGLGGPEAPLDMLRGVPVAAFAGIARPSGFFNALRESGLTLSSVLSFPDHHPYREEDIHRISDQASRSGARLLITTEKDMVRLPEPVRSATLAAVLDLDFGSDRQAIEGFLRDRIPRQSRTPS